MFITVNFNPIIVNDDGSMQSAKELIINSVQDTTYIRPVYLNYKEIGTVDIKEINFREYTVRFSVTNESRWIYDQYNKRSLNYELCVKPNQDGETKIDFVFRPRKNNLDIVRVDNIIILGQNKSPLSNLTERQLKIISEEVKFKYIKETEFILVDIDLVDGNAIVATPYKYGAEILDKNLRVCVTLEEDRKTVFDVILVDKERLTFTQALIALDEGKIVTREKWINENVYLINIPRDTWKVDFPFKSSKKHSHFIAKVAKDFIIPWNISTEEIYVKDYIIIDKDKIN